MYINFELHHFTTTAALGKQSRFMMMTSIKLILIQLLLIEIIIVIELFWRSNYGTASMYTYDRHCKNLSGVNYVNYGRFDGYDENGKRQPVLRETK
jgi:hypothetical protein